ncbi:MAG TPA: DUF465 domain-containing protein [Methylocystis sp.]|nr:DUF465 domain-containing protein [Methylocystis sp.]
MSHVAHELSEQFPGQAETIRALKESNAHFAKIAELYHEINRTIHRMETEVEPVADETLEAMKKRRLLLMDEITQFLATA